MAYAGLWERRIPAEAHLVELFRREWEQALSPYSLELVQMACGNWIREHNKPPMISDLIELCRKLKGDAAKMIGARFNSDLENEMIAAEIDFKNHLSKGGWHPEERKNINTRHANAYIALEQAGYSDQDVARVLEKAVFQLSHFSVTEKQKTVH